MNIFERARRIALVNSAGSILSWDQETYLPSGSAEYRSEQLSYLAAHAHDLSTSPEYLKSLADAESTDNGTDTTLSTNLRELRRESDRSVKIPTDLVARESTAQSAAHHAWIAARKASDFSIFAPHLQNLLDFALEKASLWGFRNEPYDALLEGYERGTSTSVIASLFEKLQKELALLSAQAVENTKEAKSRLPPGTYPIAAQQDFNALVAAEIGFDFHHGRIDTTTHPFCTTLGPNDIRLTTRYEENDFTSSLFGVMHEAGHGMYEQGLPAGDFGLPSGSAVSLGIHESQSRLWENQVGRSPEFWEKFYPIARQHFSQLKDFPLEKFLRYIHRAEFSPIRVEADEATYDLHIILRFQMERMLLNREITVSQVPETWNDLFRKSFGFTPENDAHGCLQDIHWSMGGIGYFPTYTLGNINAAQLFQAAMADPEIQSATSAANYAPLLKWLQQNVHRHGATHNPTDLIKKATGSPRPPAITSTISLKGICEFIHWSPIIRQKPPIFMFIVIEGIDGTGKSTQAKLLAAHLTSLGRTVILSREPTDGPWGTLLRNSASTGRLSPEEELETFLKDRRQHVEEKIAPALSAGHTVILDRYYFSTMAYQGARGFDPQEIRRRNEAFAPVPDLLIILDLDVGSAIERIGVRGDTANEFEQRASLARCREIFLSLKDEPFARLIPTDSSPEEISEQIIRTLPFQKKGDPE